MSEKAYLQRLGIKNNKIVTALTMGVVAIGVGIDFWVGSLIDKAINKKRAQKADNA
jgi:hypothetical protein